MTLSENYARQLLDIAGRFGTPSYVTDVRVIDRRVRSLRRHLDGCLSRLLYALKANALPEIVEFLRDQGLGVDVVSPGELILAERLGIEPSKIFYSANNMTAAELDFSISRHVTVNIGELNRLEALARQRPGARVCLRINTQHGAGHHRHVITAGQGSKFGIPLHDLDIVQSIVKRGALRIIGLHQHIGSGNLNVEPYRLSIETLFRVAERFPELEFVNIGGGFGVPYRPGDSEVDLPELAQAVAAGLTGFHDTTGRHVDIWMEPGRYLVADSGVLLIEVNTIKTSHGHTYVGTNSGMNHLVRPAMYDAYHQVVNLSNPSGAPHTYQVVGNICESSDFFARDRELPETREGDVLAVLGAGAYGSSMMSEYNMRPAPAEVFVELDGRARVVKKRESPSELVDRVLSNRV